MLNGDGLRVVLWVAGCEHMCEGCHNPETWDPEFGIPFDDNALAEIHQEMRQSYISGITFSGGDPLHPANREEITELAKELKYQYPGKTIWLYTGYSWDEIKEYPIIDYIDVLVDGEYKAAKRDVDLRWRGSSNQRVIDVVKSKMVGQIVLWVN